ncbi:MAG: ABC transporter permease [Leptospiraceae bacterium]|nr:ABC transporter permease [Leptospiraceae bacterium]
MGNGSANYWLQTFRLASRNLFRNKRRTSITLVSIALSVALTSFMRFFTYGSHQEIIDEVVELTTGYLQVSAYGWIESRRNLNRALDYTAELEKELEHPDVTVISPRIESGALAASGDHSAFVHVQGADPTREKMVTKVFERIKKGDYLAEDYRAKEGKEGVEIHQIVVGQRLADNLEADVGSEISLVGSRFDGSTGAVIARIVGIVKTGNPELDGNYVWTDLQTSRELFSPGNPEQGIVRYTSIALGAKNALVAKRIYDDLSERFPRPQTELSPENSRNYDPVVLYWDDLNQDLVQYLVLDQLGNEVTLAFLIIIMASGVLTTVEMSLHERKREFGILMAIGTRGSQLIRVVLLEVILLLFWGMLPGILIGVGVGYYFQFNPIVLGGEFSEAVQEMGGVSTLRAIVDFQETYIAILSLAIPSLVLSYLAIRRIPKLKPVEVINTL